MADVGITSDVSTMTSSTMDEQYVRFTHYMQYLKVQMAEGGHGGLRFTPSYHNLRFYYNEHNLRFIP